MARADRSPSGSATRPSRPGGRPKAEDSPVAMDQILAAALRAFATQGYEGMSVRTLNRELGVSHSLLNQRFGSKEKLWYAAVDAGFGELANQLRAAVDPVVADPLDQLRRVLRRFLEYSAEHPELLGLMNAEGAQETPRLAYIFDTYIAPSIELYGRVLKHLIDEGRVRPVGAREIHFLFAHGAAAPFTLTPLARRFEGGRLRGSANTAAYIDLVTDILMTGIQTHPADPEA